jgi:hypothetical protein
VITPVTVEITAESSVQVSCGMSFGRRLGIFNSLKLAYEKTMLSLSLSVCVSPSKVLNHLTLFHEAQGCTILGNSKLVSIKFSHSVITTIGRMSFCGGSDTNTTAFKVLKLYVAIDLQKNM